VKIFNLHGDDWDRAEERKGWRSKEAWVGARIDAELIGASMSELEPGDRLWPYHTHHANEEWLPVVSGTPTLRTPEGEQELKEAMSPPFCEARTARTSSSTAQMRRSAS
jgi:uncharacterized cupin superfamily protein